MSKTKNVLLMVKSKEPEGVYINSDGRIIHPIKLREKPPILPNKRHKPRLSAKQMVQPPETKKIAVEAVAPKQELKPIAKGSLDQDSPPYGRKLRTLESYDGLRRDWVVTCLEKEIFREQQQKGTCPVRFKETIYHIPWRMLKLR